MTARAEIFTALAAYAMRRDVVASVDHELGAVGLKGDVKSVQATAASPLAGFAGPSVDNGQTARENSEARKRSPTVRRSPS